MLHNIIVSCKLKVASERSGLGCNFAVFSPSLSTREPTQPEKLANKLVIQLLVYLSYGLNLVCLPILLSEQSKLVAATLK